MNFDCSPNIILGLPSPTYCDLLLGGSDIPCELQVPLKHLTKTTNLGLTGLIKDSDRYRKGSTLSTYKSCMYQ